MDRVAVRKLDSSGKVTIATIAESILPALSVPEEQADYGFLLSKYTTVAQQLDSFWNNVDPLLCVSLPIPKKPTPPNNFPIPQLLSCMIPPEDSAAQIMPDSSWTDTENDQLLVKSHNEMTNQILGQYNLRVGEFRSHVKINLAKNVKEETASRKRNIDKIAN